jgi:hypothetical protein
MGIDLESYEYKSYEDEYENKKFKAKEDLIKKQIIADHYRNLLGKDSFVEYNNTLAEIIKTWPHESMVISVQYIEKFEKKHNIKNGVDYARFDSRAFFSSETDRDNFEKFQNSEQWIERTIEDADTIIEHNYSKIIFIKNNKLTASINVVPKHEKFYMMLEAVIDFYILNKYDLPENSKDFIKNIFQIDRTNNYFTILLKDETDAASLITNLSDIAEVVTE